MKDLAMLMVDLAYASLLLHDKEMAGEVIELEHEIDTLSHHLQINTMLVARNAKDAEALQSILQVALLTHEISDAAGDIVEVVLRGAEPHPILVQGLRELQEPFLSIRVSEKSPLARKTISQLKIRTEMGVNILAIQRKDQWIVAPEGKEKIFPGDTLIGRGGTTGVEKFRLLAVQENRPKV